MKNFILFVLFLFPAHAFPQFFDDFTDGDFTAFPTWEGDVEKFRVNESGQLQLDADKDGSPAQLAVPSEQLLNRQWECWLKMDFNPTSSNYVRLYLSCDNADPEQALNSLFIRIGYTKKNICLLSKSGETIRTLMSGADKRVDKPFIAMKIKTELTKNGYFSLYSKLEGESDFRLEGSCQVENIPQSHYFGISCTYTSTRKDLFFFDDFEVKILNENDEPGPGGNTTGTENVTVIPDIAVGSYQIKYNFPNSGSRCRVMIFDSMGRLIATPYNNELLSSEGYLYWNGKDNSGQPILGGIYIVFMEVWQPDGRVLKYKLPVVGR